MNRLIIKLGAAGDVVRTTTLLHQPAGETTWLTSPENRALLDGIESVSELLDWDQREALRGRRFDHVINLEDSQEAAELLESLQVGRLSGAFLRPDRRLDYTDDLAEWFDMSLISRFGREQADRLKLQNRRSYQEILFAGLGLRFQGEPYRLPAAEPTELEGDPQDDCRNDQVFHGAILGLSAVLYMPYGASHFDNLRENHANAVPLTKEKSRVVSGSW